VRQTRPILLAGLVSALLVGGVSAAQAGPVDPSATAGSPVTALLGGAGWTPYALAPGCYGQTDQPHPSSHAPGYVNVLARTVCAGRGVYVSTRLYRDRWYGAQHLASNSRSGTGSITVSTAWRCAGTGTYTYRAYSYHEATNAGYANTVNSRRFTC
jgi:hypothetical protein